MDLFSALQNRKSPNSSNTSKVDFSNSGDGHCLTVAMASRGLRTLALTYNGLEKSQYSFGPEGEAVDEPNGGKRGFAVAPEEDLVLMAIVGIKARSHNFKINNMEVVCRILFDKRSLQRSSNAVKLVFLFGW